ncbi:MAG: glycogen debranching enzyme, partial [Planctomycetales bacterium 12-60-4]
MNSLETLGKPFPLGANVTPAGVNFSLFSRTATGVDLLLFDREDDKNPIRTISLDPVSNHTYHYWHTFVPNLRPGQLYGYRVIGPTDHAHGLRFDCTKVLLDPYGKGLVIPKNYSPEFARHPGDNTTTAMQNVVVDSSAYDWQGDSPLLHPSARTVIYEMHLRGFTRHPNSGVGEKTRGTYAGLIEKIPYLQNLGITAVELLPIFGFDPHACPPGLV